MIYEVNICLNSKNSRKDKSMKNRKIKTERIYKTINKKSNKNREKNSNELNGAKIKNLFNNEIIKPISSSYLV